MEEHKQTILECLSLGNKLFDDHQTKIEKDINNSFGSKKDHLIKQQKESVKNRDDFNLILSSLK